MFSIFTCVISYMVAAISPAIIISNKVLKKDIRTLGSGNAGTTNAIRTMGKKVGALVFILDLLKVVISYLLIVLFAKIFKEEITPLTKTIYMFASVLGHSYPVYYSFKGGKGVAVLLMTALIIDYKIALICIGVGVLLIAITRYVSLGSMVGATLLIIVSIFMKGSFNMIFLILTVAIIIYNHRENIKRLIAGKENKLF